MRRPELWCLGLGLAFALPACGGTPVEATTIKDSPSRLVVAPERPTSKKPTSPNLRPSTDPPPPRSEPQVSDARLAEILAQAESRIASGDKNGAIRALRECANRVPASPRCEGILGMQLVGIAPRRAECRYYLAEAARTDDPQADADFYLGLGDALKSEGRFEDAALAYQRRIDRGAGEAADYGRLAVVLQGIMGSQGEAADALRRGFELDPTRIDFLYDEAVLRGQLPGQAEQASTLLREYLSRWTDKDDARVQMIEARIAELEAVAAAEERSAAEPSRAAQPT